MKGFQAFLLRGNGGGLGGRKCAECLSDIPIEARRCKYCASTTAPAAAAAAAAAGD
jgi:hypothetical protein